MRLWKGRPQTLTFEAFGVRVGLDVADPELETAVADMLPPPWRSSRSGELTGRFGLTRAGTGGYRITADDSPVSQHATLEVALGMLESDIQQFIAVHASGWVLVHAGAVSHGRRALLIPGESFSGKTTLVAALVKAGATYYSDEFAVLDREGRVHGYPRPLSIRPSNGQSGRQVHDRDLGGVEADESAEPGVVVLTHYRPGAAWLPQQLSPAQGLAALLAMTPAARDHPVESMQTLRRATTGATIVEGERGEAGPTAAALLELLDG